MYILDKQIECGVDSNTLICLCFQITELVKSGDIGQNVIQMLWERFTMKIPGTTPEESRAAVTLIAMAAK